MSWGMRTRVFRKLYLNTLPLAVAVTGVVVAEAEHPSPEKQGRSDYPLEKSEAGNLVHKNGRASQLICNNSKAV